MNKKLQEALKLLQITFIINRKVKRGRVGRGLSNYLYSQKNEQIKEIIALIKDHQLPIKYGWGTDGQGGKVIYFEYLGKQISFHDPEWLIECKRFKGKWDGRRHRSSPISHLV